MRIRDALLAAVVATVAVACETSTREWMKLNEKYTTEDFRRDYADCSGRGKLDQACMRSRGWVDVSASKPEPTRDPEAGRPGTRKVY